MKIERKPERKVQQFVTTQQLCLVDRHRLVDYPVQVEIIPSPQPRPTPSCERGRPVVGSAIRPAEESSNEKIDHTTPSVSDAQSWP